MRETLQQLQLDTLDAMLIHMPWGNSAAELASVWQGLVQALWPQPNPYL